MVVSDVPHLTEADRDWNVFTSLAHSKLFSKLYSRPVVGPDEDVCFHRVSSASFPLTVQRATSRTDSSRFFISDFRHPSLIVFARRPICGQHRNKCENEKNKNLVRRFVFDVYVRRYI